ncbi:ABC transporter substrate-binding protein [Chitinasiproducens palmae]|uniref:ABC transporter substrate-binding protein n=1 Tax=Chitinasiproducens palmae TaxID=1770053 RepID=UPI000B85B76B|nr:ABC transporter substrate-binding protein [Chitinasiproducens palmae]
MKKIAAALGLALLALNAHAKDWSTVRIGVDPSYPPFESKAPNGQHVGLDIELGNALCARMKVKCVWVDSDFDGLIPGLRAKKFDAVISSLSVTDKRREQIAFSNKLFAAPARMVAKAGSPLQPTPESLKGKRIGVEQGTTQETYAKTYWQSKGVQVVSYQNQDQVYADLISGRLDAALQDELQASAGFLKTARGKGFAFAGPEVKDAKVIGEGTAVGLRKEDADLKAKFDQAIVDIRHDNTYQTLQKKYFDFDIYGD